MVKVRIEFDETLTTLPTAMQALSTGFKKGSGQINRTAINLVSRLAEENFRNSIIREETSATLGGQTYRPRSRVTGRFTFGPGKTFTGALLKNLGPDIYGFGYPIVARADARTKKAWRGLEFGWSSMRMPKGFWRDASGSRIRQGRKGETGISHRLFGGEEFVPGSRVADQRVAGIEAKQFITTAFEDVVHRYVQPEYDKLNQRLAREFTKKGK